VKRGARQLAEVMAIMDDGGWRTLREIAVRHGAIPEASASARLRAIRSLGFDVERRAAHLPGNHARRVFEYRVRA
jgi:hypothetical protein